jgi:2-polyprenyl-3-methyl-5-hydroxy-6-metoxy-1,4-benzoquinol methylase
VDISQEMLHRLTSHAAELGVTIESVQSTFQELKTRVHKKFDAVFCLGNSLTHLLSIDELRQSLDNFAGLLHPQGILFLQNLNYDRIIAQRDRVQSVKETGATTFIRYYDYEKDVLRFNILKLERHDNTIDANIKSIMLRPLLKDELLCALSETGFTDTKVFGSISMDEFDLRNSKDTVVLATKAS